MIPKYFLAASITGILALTVQPASAAPLYWDGPSGDWDVVGNWSTVSSAATPDPAAVPGSSDVATFNITGQNSGATVSLVADQSALGLSFVSTGTVALQSSTTARTLSLGSDGITAGAGTTTLTVGSSTAAQNVNLSLTSDQAWAFNGTNTAGNGLIIRSNVSLGVTGAHTLSLGGTTGSTAISGIIGNISDGSGTLGITLNGAATNRWNFSGNNSYTGLTSITAGALGISTANSLGATSAGTTVSSGGALFFRNTGNVTYAAEPLTIAGIGPASSARGALRQVASGGSTWTGAITADTTSGPVRIGADAGSLTLSNTADITTIGSGTIEFDTVGTITVNGDISGSVGITKVTAGTSSLALGGANTYTGATRVSGGVLSVTGSLANTSSVLVDAGASLRGTGTINPSVLTTVNGTVGAGATFGSIGTLSLGTLSITSTGTVGLDFNSSSAAFDRLNVSGDLTLDLGNATKLVLTDVSSTGTPLALGTAFTVIDYSGTWNGGLFNFGGTVIRDDIDVITVGLNSFTIDYNGGASGNDVRLAVVPEPASAAVLLGGFAMLTVLGRNRVRR